MAHDISLVPTAEEGGSKIGRITIHNPETGKTGQVRISRGSRSRGGIHVKITDGGTAIVRGEDLYALREFLSEIPEHEFVKPAPPVKAPPRWAAGDCIKEVQRGGKVVIWTRDGVGRWTPQRDVHYNLAAITDSTMAEALKRSRDDTVGRLYGSSITLIHQASGRDI